MKSLVLHESTRGRVPAPPLQHHECGGMFHQTDEEHPLVPQIELDLHDRGGERETALHLSTNESQLILYDTDQVLHY